MVKRFKNISRENESQNIQTHTINALTIEQMEKVNEKFPQQLSIN